MGTRVDLVVINNGLEYLCGEDKPSNDSTEILEDRHFKIAKTIKDMLWQLLDGSNFDAKKMKEVVSVGISAFKFQAHFDLCDIKLGYVARITRSPGFTIPPTLKNTDILLESLSKMLATYALVESSIVSINAPANRANLKSRLKRPYSEVDDGTTFRKSMKRNVNAATPEDDSSTRSFQVISNSLFCESLWLINEVIAGLMLHSVNC